MISTSLLKENAQKYAEAGVENTYYLAYRDIPSLVKQYVSGIKAIDFGCGAGRSTRFLKSLGLEVIGVDHNKEMLVQAVKADNSSHYLYMESNKIPLLDNSCDFIFCCFVLFTIPNREQMLSVLMELQRCVKTEGTLIVVTNSEDLYVHNWLSYYTDYPENRFPKSGDLLRVKLTDIGMETTNYYWKDSDYSEFFRTANFKLVDKLLPRGKVNENKAFASELKHTPYAIYVLKK